MQGWAERVEEGAELVARSASFGRAGSPSPLQPMEAAGAGGITRLARVARPFVRSFPRRLSGALTLESERGAAFLCVPVLLGLGAVLYFAAPFEPQLFPLLLALGGVSALAAFFRARSRLAFLFLAAVALCLVGALAGKVETLRFSTKMLGSEVTTRLTGRVAQVEHLAADRLRLTLDVLDTERPRLRFAPDRVRVTASKVSEPISTGTVVECFTRLMPPSGPTIPGGYDFSFQSYFDGIGASGFFLGTPKVIEATAPAFPSLGWIENVRETIAARIRGQIGGPEGEIAAALIVGVRGGIPEPVNEALRRTGLAHVLSISGLHMAMVAALAMGGIRALLAGFPGFASRRPIKKIAAAIALLVVSIYLAFSGIDVAAMRSFLMLAVMLVAVLFDRAALSVRNLALSAAIVVLVWPHEILGPSFQMSFAATGALVASYAAWAEHRAARKRQAPAPRSLGRRVLGQGGTLVFGLLATSLVAGVATAAFGVYHFQRVSPLSLPANLAVMPIVSVLVMPFALMGMLAMPFGLDGPFFAVMGLGLHWMIAVTGWFSERSPVDAVGAIPAAALVLAVLALLGFTVASTWLRYAALPLAASAAILSQTASRADVYISEDGRLVGVVRQDGKLAVNVARGGGFTLLNWTRASAAPDIVRPFKRAQAEASPPGYEDRFSCTKEGTCGITAAGARSIVYVRTAQAASGFCRTAALLVVDDASARPCDDTSAAPVIVTKRDLALAGGATVSFGASAKDFAEIVFSVAEPLRPWHLQRKFSRAARGLPERKPASRKSPASAVVRAVSDQAD